MFSFFKKKSTAPAEAPIETPAAPPPDTETSASGGAMGWLRKSFGAAPADREAPADQEAPALPATTDSTPPTVALPTPKPEGERQGWMQRLKSGLRKTGSSIATVFTGTQINDALYEELEDALLMADTGVKATQHLLDDLKRRMHNVTVEGHRQFNPGWHLAVDLRNMLIVSECIARAALERTEWHAAVGNAASARVAQTLGFRFEGVRRRALITKEGRRDGWAAALLPSDDRTPQRWPVV